MISKRTKSLKVKCAVINVLHYLFMFGPIVFYTIYSFASNNITTSYKVVLTLTTCTSIIIALLGLVVSIKHRAGLHRTMLWMFVLGIVFALKNANSFIYILAISAIIDELILIKLKDRWEELLRTNKEIDRRQ